jgi:hypothetical protein
MIDEKNKKKRSILRRRNRPRHRLASLRAPKVPPLITTKGGYSSLTLFIINATMKFIFDNCRVSEATPIGAEGDCALVKLIRETVPQTIHKLI